MFTNIIQYIFCIALLNDYNVCAKIIILIFLKMLKNSSLLSWVYGILFLLLLGAFLLSKFQKADDTLAFEYPTWNIDFAGELVPLSFQDDFYTKERFDKEFLLTSNNLYQFYLYVKRYPLYISTIEEKLKLAEIPDDFKYLAIAESALREDVVSSAGAGGIWQFMPETAKRYGLRVDENIDERYHFEKATDAAIVYIWDLYDLFWNWTLVAAAYNRWENGLKRAMESQKVDTYYDLYLNEETSRYVFRILAIKYVMLSYFERKELIDTLIGWIQEKPKTKEILVSEISDLSKWALENGYNYKDIKILNRWIVSESLPKWDWKIQVFQK